jgi:hypothetical protein
MVVMIAKKVFTYMKIHHIIAIFVDLIDASNAIQVK